MDIFNTKQSLTELEEKINNCVPEMQQLGAFFINFKLQKKFLEEQNIYNKKQLCWSRALSIFTAILALATIALVFVTK
jgi:hypothetical protein